MTKNPGLQISEDCYDVFVNKTKRGAVMTISFDSFPWALITIYTVVCVGAGMLISEYFHDKNSK